VLKARDIHVDSQNGVVTMTGTVNTDLEKGAAGHMASEVDGVKQVVNQLTVSAAPPEAPPAEQAAAPPAPAPARHRTRTYASRAPAATESASAPLVSATPAAPAAAPPPPAPASAPAPPASQPVTIPSGTVVTVRMIDSIDSAQNRPGEIFAATVDAPVAVSDKVVIQRNSDARVRLVESRSAGHMTGRSELQLELVSVSVGGNAYTVQSGYYELQGASRGKRTAETVGGGAGLGALIGAIAGRGKGAAIGAAVGAGAGTAVQAATSGQQVKVPSETKIDFTLKAPLTVSP